MPNGLQLLHHVRLLRRQGQELPFLRDRRSALRRYARDGAEAGCAVVLRHGRELSAESSTRHALAGTHESCQQGMGALRLLVNQRNSQILHGRIGTAWSVVDL